MENYKIEDKRPSSPPPWLSRSGRLPPTWDVHIPVGHDHRQLPMPFPLRASRALTCTQALTRSIRTPIFPSTLTLTASYASPVPHTLPPRFDIISETS